MAILPEGLKQIDPKDLDKSVQIIDENVRYLAERIDFAINLINKRLDELAAERS